MPIVISCFVNDNFTDISHIGRTECQINENFRQICVSAPKHETILRAALKTVPKNKSIARQMKLFIGLFQVFRPLPLAFNR